MSSDVEFLRHFDFYFYCTMNEHSNSVDFESFVGIAMKYTNRIVLVWFSKTAVVVLISMIERIPLLLLKCVDLI